jgi:hypothetical protein
VGVEIQQERKVARSLYPAEAGFTAQIILGNADAKKASAMRIGPRVRRIIAGAHPYPEGRWLFIPVNSQKDIQDIRLLKALKCGTGREKTDRSVKTLRQPHRNR